jgi:hypothetical protein
LVGVSQSQGVHFSINDNLNENSTISDIRNTLFNSENVVLDPSRSDRGLSKLTHPPKMTNDEE